MKQIPFPTSDDRLLWDIWMSAFQFPALAVADELDLFRRLEQGPASAAEVAAGLSLDRGSTQALLGVMAALGLLQQHAGRFALTEVARVFLLDDSPYSWRAALRVFRHIPVTYTAMRDALRNREHARTDPGDAPEDWIAEPAFTRAMHSFAFPAAMVLAQRIDLRGARTFLDVGGGSGAYCIALALRYPDIRFTVLEAPKVCDTTREFLREYSVEDRIEVLPGDMHAETWPSGYDAHLLSNIFHTEDRSGCLKLARRSYEALPPRGRLYTHEVLENDGKDGPLAATSFTVAMRYFNGEGGQYSGVELTDILADAGFVDVTVTPTSGYYSLVSGSKP